MLGVQPVTAEDSRSTVDALADHVLASWQTWGLPGTAPRRLDWVISARSYVQKVVVNFVHPTTSKLVAVAKIANGPSAVWIVENEHKNLVEVRDNLRAEPALRDAVPVPYLLSSQGGVCALVESALDGSPTFGVRVADGTFFPTEQLDECFEWLVRFHELSRSQSAVRQHGDYALPNTLRRPDGTMAVLDWENAGDGYPPCYDLFSLASSAAFQAYEAMGKRGSGSDAFVTVFGTRSPLSDRVGHYLRSYCLRMGFDRADAHDWLMEFFRVKGERMASLYGARNTYARAWAALAEQAAKAAPAFLDSEK